MDRLKFLALGLASAGLLSMPALAQQRGIQPPTVGLAGTVAPRRASMKTVDTPYYILHTDLTDAEGREADLRMTRMFEEYQRVTAGFAGKVDRKLDFYLFRNQADYVAAGAPPKSAGVYMRFGNGDRRLMAFTGGAADASTWQTIQHEGFHQFIDAGIKAPLPIWVNEGLAEYFGEGIWTGDGFITGLIPAERLQHVRRGIQGPFQPFKKLMALNDATWIADLNESNYDEAWAMVHFLGHADNGRYLAPFSAFMNQVAKGTDGTRAWENVFGRDTDAFQRQFAAWWMSLPDRPTQTAYLQAMVQTQTSFLARAALQRMQYPDAEHFFRDFDPNKMTPTRDLWLPPAMWTEYRDIALNAGGWKLESGGSPKLMLQLQDGTVITGMYALANGRVARVGVQVAPGHNALALPSR